MQVDIKQNYFELFGVPIAFHLDDDVLHSAHLKLQAAFHPDRFINGTELEKRLAVQKAAWINEAYEVLKNPVKRARYMLEVSGLEMNDDHETTSDTVFLMEQIELREEMDECRSCKDPMRCCDHITGKLDQRSKEFSTNFISLYQQGYLEQARQVSKKMQFVERILEQIDEYQLKLEDDIL
ncbi:MAG: Fe-S protein assembly co-chaperone HscB [Gammaproteobacteria bacterium]|jgi:molecular chaperone HscB|nr:Fe-S protein assembly co-chaperone HscB [Gammaproteobacteria bacterium]MBT3725055.1 Fe-S protein assembly co-chaperone HscB [Gammaproteobacteria bacterium]MBT4078046.1 Fe-S protein assembly co-chaperone HscB [Gammaproteobacteria bacterium]MBT4195097.1 Fe-S protein assembly co-chaperone HscB [Gammaproteobacteria bacterium]MBT4451334.1 Fe-S protein assembly co-chaperone HscB [Gammaproteobacteria bacterium]